MPDSHRRLPPAAVALVLLALVVLPGASEGEGAGCPGNPVTLSPKGGPGARFTMLLRINKGSNVVEYEALEAASGQIRARDIFVVNTRWKGATPAGTQWIASRLRDSFPCNRIIALNGLGADPRRPGYSLSLADSPQPWAVMLDWEQRDWGHARATNPWLSSWKRHFGRSIKRLGATVSRVAGEVDVADGGIAKIGAIPSYYPDWHYGKIARALDARNRRFGHRRGGIQAVATQASCQKYHGGKKGMRHVAGRLMRQYNRAKRKRRNLAVQISFSDHARVKRHMPIRSVNEWRAARCLGNALRAGAGAVLFWASPESMRALFQNHRFRKLRHRG
jgi:hypothetical protein